MIWFFVFFFISGLCSLLYELVWLRMAMADFGVTTAMVSIVLSAFMAGLGVGSWTAGRWMRTPGTADLRPWALQIYGAIELMIGFSGIAVPHELSLGRRILAGTGASSSLTYYLVAGLLVVCTLVPWCALMGATLPVGMQAIAQRFREEARRSFSYLYMANVAGAVLGIGVSLVLVELYGFHATLRAGVACNWLIAVAVALLARRAGRLSIEPAGDYNPYAEAAAGGQLPLALLFLTGSTSLGMEVVWVRQYTPYLGTVVYAFAFILAAYLLATFAGSCAYRWLSDRGSSDGPLLWCALALTALFPLVTASPFVAMASGPRLLLGILPFNAFLGYVTPMLVDRFSGGNPGKAGTAYAVNVAGCILGPLLGGFVLLPWTSERWALAILAAPWLLFGLREWLRAPMPRWKQSVAVLAMVASAGLIAIGRGYQDRYHGSLVLRDSTATVIATGSGRKKQLLVNGYGVTSLHPATKIMAHVPLALLDHPPHDVLDICFGMGTTFRSLLTWNLHVTAVELVPSVPQAFGFFHSDGPALLHSPLGHVVIDDGRRYLERTDDEYDLITIDPPPPVEAAGSSLLYSEEFYAVAKRHLRKGGILAQWLPYGDPQVLSAVARALKNSFPYVRVTRWHDGWGFFFWASAQPLPVRNAADLVGRMPSAAVADLTEWSDPPGDRSAGVQMVDGILHRELTLDDMIAVAPTTPTLQDDRPINEYYRVRRVLWGKGKQPQRFRYVAVQ